MKIDTYITLTTRILKDCKTIIDSKLHFYIDKYILKIDLVKNINDIIDIQGDLLDYIILLENNTKYATLFMIIYIIISNNIDTIID